MRRTLGVCVVLLLAIPVLPMAASGQQSGQTRAQPRLEPNYPNPFNPTTTISFTLPDAYFEGGRSAIVTVYIRNQLSQLVAIPEALDYTEQGGDRQPVLNLEYRTPGTHKAYWDGTDRFGKKVASAVYYLELVVNGERFRPRAIVVAK
jgi:hypothetical protein